MRSPLEKRDADKNSVTGPNSLPAGISVPKGGGAIRGIGEKFSANPVTGTASLNLPLFSTPARSNFQPGLVLAYDSGAGNGPFGLGWHLNIPAITRKTDKGLPRYLDDDSEVFILSDAEDLVPSYKQRDAEWMLDVVSATLNHESYTVQRYRPRVEGLFARIERWRSALGEVHWKTIARDNVTSIYGLSRNGRVFDPDDSSRVFTWLLELSYDDKGNAIVYEYRPENRDSVPASAQEVNRETHAGRYIKRIKYGNASPYHPTGDGGSLPADWLFEMVFDYGEHDAASPAPGEAHTWPVRDDSFSSYRAGFEIRTHRLCRRIFMFHHFPDELGAPDSLVRSTDFTYDENLSASFITSVTQSGYLPQADGTYLKNSLPPLEFTYTHAEIDETVRSIDAGSLENLPSGLDGVRYHWIDLDGEGLSGILTEHPDAWFYKRNLSNLPLNDSSPPSMARFGPLEIVATKPSIANVNAGQQQLMDLGGAGKLCLVQFSRPMAGFYEREDDGQWLSFTPFQSIPNIEWNNNPNLKSLDLTGDGHADILITEDDVFRWYPSRAKHGFGPAETANKALDEEKGPALVFADATQSVYVADMSGDSLTDIVRIRNGEICYWPNLGYGRFGAKVTMNNPPRFDNQDQFEQRRIRLVDIDGSGTTDIIYLGRNRVTLWFNQSGNSWSEPRHLSKFPKIDNLTSVLALDLLGTGTACLVWSSPLPGEAHQPMRYIDLMSGRKPHLLSSVKNNLGAETRVQYAASTRFYLQDRAAGNPWITKLPFPVQVVERVETFDYVSMTKLVTTYKYHHGYFDGPEREFRGFGMVEQFDAESFSRYSGAGLFTETPETDGEEFHLPPVHTRTWFHNGAYIAQNRISHQYQAEYYRGDPLARLLPDTVLPEGLSAAEEREACRALKGRILRQEVYADDASALRGHPYSVTEHSYRLRMVQPRQNNRHAVWFTHSGEVLQSHYERNPHDPRVSHQLNLAVDEFGNVTKSAAVAYPRRPRLSTPEQPHPPDHQRERRETHVVYTESDFTIALDTEAAYRLPLPSEVRTFELTGTLRLSEVELFTVESLLRAGVDAAEIHYEDSQAEGLLQKRLIERVRTLYLKDDLSAPLPLGELESLALPFESYKQAFTPGLLMGTFGAKLNPAAITAILRDEGKYRELDGAWWIPSGRLFFSPEPGRPDPAFARAHFYLAQGSIDPFGSLTRVTHDRYQLLTTQTEDALGNIVTAHNDYRVMQPDLVTDPNDNRSMVRFDALGLVVATALMGKPGRGEGDTLDDPTTRFEYNLFNWLRNRQPNFVHTFAREQHGASNHRWQESFSYFDGVGREVMKKTQAKPGMVQQLDAAGSIVEADTTLRWVGSGRTIFDNKGNPIKKYEPFFSVTPEYETEERLARVGVTLILRYDSLARLIRTDLPNGTFSRVEFDPWQQINWDENDTVRESRWYAERGSPDPLGPRPADPETRAAWLAGRHANTPAVKHLDSLGRVFLTIADNGSAEKLETRVELDIEGNQRSVTDARGLRVMEYAYDMLGTKIFQRSTDAGERWILSNVAGQPLRAWDGRGHVIRTTYDQLQRPAQLFVSDGVAEKLAERTVYGEPPRSEPAAEAEVKRLNLRGRVRQHFDGAGLISNDEFDFKGNLLRSTRQFAVEYREQLNWTAAPAIQAETFTNRTTYDALNRPITLTTPDESVIRPAYNETGLLERVSVNVRDAASETVFVNNIDYDAKGQRQSIEYRIVDSGGASRVVRTEYDYDPLTFRLSHLTTIRTTDGARLQDLSYTYDPVGNITAIHDDAQQTIYFRNTRVEPSVEYEYDALYRLVSATGREHLGQNASGRLNPPRQADHDDSFRTNLPQPGDGDAMGNYTERYEYDAVGNILRMIHEAGAAGSWTRRYAYGADSNRLLRTSLPGDPVDGPYSARYEYDAHGNMTSMPHLSLLEWDFKDQLHLARQQVVADGEGETAYYVYDSAGRRARKVIERSGGSIREERFYLGGFEVYRERSNGRVSLERETLHIMDDQHRIALVETKTIDAAAPPFTPAPLVRYQLGNHLGSAALELDSAGEIISYEEYFPYGSPSYQAVRTGVEVSRKRYRYAAKERDNETGLAYYGARYYALWLGRWISCDPIGLKDGPNLYVAVHSNPVNRIDLDGRIGRRTRATVRAGIQIANAVANQQPLPHTIDPNTATPTNQPSPEVHEDPPVGEQRQTEAENRTLRVREPEPAGGEPPRPRTGPPSTSTTAQPHTDAPRPGSCASGMQACDPNPEHTAEQNRLRMRQRLRARIGRPPNAPPIETRPGPLTLRPPIPPPEPAPTPMACGARCGPAPAAPRVSSVPPPPQLGATTSRGGVGAAPEAPVTGTRGAGGVPAGELPSGAVPSGPWARGANAVGSRLNQIQGPLAVVGAVLEAIHGAQALSQPSPWDLPDGARYIDPGYYTGFSGAVGTVTHLPGGRLQIRWQTTFLYFFHGESIMVFESGPQA